MKALKAISLPALTCLFIFLLCLNSYADDAQNLISAAKEGDISTVHALLAKGSDVNAKDVKYGWTPLMWASREDHLDVVQALLAKGADVNVKANDGWTALMVASKYSRLEIVQAFLTKGADVNAKDNDDWTALSLAEEKGHSDVAQLLIKAGAKRLLENDGNARINIIFGIIGIVGGIIIFIYLITRKSKHTKWGIVALACAAGLAILWGILILALLYGRVYFSPRTLSLISQFKTFFGCTGLGMLFTLLIAKQI